MKRKNNNNYLLLITFFLFSLTGYCQAEAKRVLIIDSYHPENDWSKNTGSGFAHYFSSIGIYKESKIHDLNINDYLESEKIIIKRIWLDTKRKKKKQDMINALNYGLKVIEEFRPKILVLGDDNALDLFGNHYFATKTKIVFWGVNGSPIRYNFFKSLNQPGYNITGVYQSMYHLENMLFMKRLLPFVKNITVVGDDSRTSRAHMSRIHHLSENNRLPLKIKSYYLSDKLEDIKNYINYSKNKTDAFMFLNLSTIYDKEGNHVADSEVIDWYTKNVFIPEIAVNHTHFLHGLLMNVEDSGINQGFEAGRKVYQILFQRENPAFIPIYTPQSGARQINSSRLKSLGVVINNTDAIDRYIE